MMKTSDKTTITIRTTVKQPPERVWTFWTSPEHITQWNFATEAWHCPAAHNDLRPGGRFSWRMEAKDGSMGFDYCGTYDHIVANKEILCTLDDGRQVRVDFTGTDDETMVSETFEMEDTNSIDRQRAGWQAILNNFKSYAETMN